MPLEMLSAVEPQPRASFGRKKAKFGFSVQTPAKLFFDDMPALIREGLRPDPASFANVRIDFKWDTVDRVPRKQALAGGNFIINTPRGRLANS